MKSFLRFLAFHPFTIAAIIYLGINAFSFLGRQYSEWDQAYVVSAHQFRIGANFYTLLPEQFSHQYTYPPFMALLAVPFTWFSQHKERFLWFTITVLSMIALWKLAWKISLVGLPDSQGRAPKLQPGTLRQWIICILGLAAAMRFPQDCLDHQQSDLFIGAILLAGCLAWTRNKDFSAATLWGFAAAMKGPPLLFAPYLIWRGRPLHALWLILLAIGLNLLPDLFHHAPPPNHLWLQTWYTQILHPMTGVGTWYSDPILNQSLAGEIYRLFATTPHLVSGNLRAVLKPNLPSALTLSVTLRTIELLLLAIAAIAMRKPFQRRVDPKRLPFEFSLVLILMLLFSPMSSKPHFCVLLLPAFCVARLAVEDKKWWAWLGWSLCILFVVLLDKTILHSPVRGDYFMWWGSVTLGTLALGAVCVAALFSTASPESRPGQAMDRGAEYRAG